MGDIDFLTSLNNMAICEQYDLDYFDKVTICSIPSIINIITKDAITKDWY